MKITFQIRTADYIQEFAIQRDSRQNLGQAELDYYTMVMILGNTCFEPAAISIEEGENDFSTVTIETSCKEFIEAATTYCAARDLNLPDVDQTASSGCENMADESDATKGASGDATEGQCETVEEVETEEAAKKK